MADQALRLRELASQQAVLGRSRTPSGLRVIAVASGKGGVGKTNVVVNLGITLARLGQRVVVFDADLGLANVDVLLGVVPRFTLYDVLKGEKSIQEIMLQAPGNIRVVPGGSGVQELANMDYYQRERFIASFREFEQDTDFLLIDTSGGISRNVLGIIAAADEVVLVLTPEPTALTDAYGVIKILSRFNLHSQVSLIVNRVSGQGEAEQTFRKMEAVVRRFLQIRLLSLGYILDDRLVVEAVKNQQPFVLRYPHCPAAQSLEGIALNLLGGAGVPLPRGEGFVTRLLRMFR